MVSTLNTKRGFERNVARKLEHKEHNNKHGFIYLATRQDYHHLSRNFYFRHNGVLNKDKGVNLSRLIAIFYVIALLPGLSFMQSM